MKADAMEDVVDTSDVEEKELIEAQKPGYYDKVWGALEMPDGQNMDMGTNNSPGAYKTSTFARLRPRTPSPRKTQHVMNFDPSPIFNHLQISLDPKSSNNPFKTPTTTPVPESLMVTSSPDLGGFESENSQPSNKLIDGNPLVNTLGFDNRLDSHRGPVCLLSPITPGRSFEWSLSPNMNGTQDDVLSGSISETDKEMAQDPGSRLIEIGSPPPPVGLFPGDLRNDLLRSMSPLTPPPPSQPSSPRISPFHSPSPIINPLDLDPQHRKYSLRNRSAKQLNPFEYDKRQYKRLLRDIPEAIVKDPNLGGGRGGRKQQHCEEGEHDWEQGEGDADAEGDGDEEWRAQEKRREKQLRREALEARMGEFGIDLESPEEDDVSLDIGGADDQPAEGGNMRGKKRKRRRKVQEFPMVAELENQQPFPKAEGQGKCQEPSAGAVGPSKRGYQEHRVNAQDDKTKKTKQIKQSLVQSKLFIIQGDGYVPITGRPRQIIHVDNEDDAFHEALAPAESIFDSHAPPRPKVKVKRSCPQNIHKNFRHGESTEPDVFNGDMNVSGPRHSKISLDFDLVSLPSGLTLGPNSYIGKGRLYDLISVLKGDKELPLPFSVKLFELHIDPDVPIAQILPTFAAACDKLYEASTMAADDNEVSMTVKVADALMHALCQMVSFRVLHINDEEERLLVTVVSDQINHLVARINDRIKLSSADGHGMDYRPLTLYWFAVEIHLRLVYARQKRVRQTEDTSSATSHAAGQFCVQLLRRLLEYGLNRTIGLLQNGRLQDTTSSNLRALELWICIFHVAPFLTNLSVSVASKPTPFWQVVEAAMDAQSNKPDSQLYESERIWRMTFSLCVVSQFSLEGLSTSTARLEAHWPIVKRALKCIRLSADVRDNSKSASTLLKRDTYLRLITARCFLLCTRWKWCLNDADDMFQELCAIFRSRQFSNLLGEPDDFPAFIRLGYETLLDTHQKDDTAFSLFLKLIVHAAKDFLKVEGPTSNRLRRGKLVRLLNLAVPVGSTTFTKDAPPTGQELSMLYNRYSAIFVAIFVDSSATNIRSRLQQIRRYISFKDADSDSRAASIRSMMHLGILLRHLNKPLDDILSWASSMLDNLLAESTSDKVQDDNPGQSTINELVVLVQLLLGSIRNIISTPTLNHSGDLPTAYPDIGLLQAWMSRIISSPLAKDHRTGIEICKCIQSFLAARQAIIPLPSIPKPATGREKQESQDEYGDGGLDLNDPALLAFLDDIEDRPDENSIADRNASAILDTFSQPLFTCVCMHLGCTAVGGRYSEADQWLECWLGCGSVLVRNKKRVWDYYFQLGESAWKDISDPFRRTHLRLRLMLTVLTLDPNIYKSHGNQILVLWFECIVSPNPTIEHDFTARLFSIDGLRHALFQNIPCAADTETGHFVFDLDEFKRLRQSFIEAVLSNVSTALNSEVGLHIPWVETLLCTMQKWIEVMNQDLARKVEYTGFVRKIVLAIHNHDALARHPSLQNLLNWCRSL